MVLEKKSGKASVVVVVMVYMPEKLGVKNFGDAEILQEVKVKGTDKHSLLTVDKFKEIVDRKRPA